MYIAVLIIILIVLITCLVLTSRASTLLSDVKGYDTDSDTERASRYLIWISVIGWLAIIAMVGAIAAVIYSGGEFGVPTIAKYMTVLAAILTLLVGVIAASASVRIGVSKLYPTGDTGNINIVKAYEYAAFASAISLLTFVFLLIAISIPSVGEYASAERIESGGTLGGGQPLIPPGNLASEEALLGESALLL